MTETRKGEVANRAVVDQIPAVSGGTSVALVPENAGQALEFAKILAGGSVGVPKHLRGQPAVCLRIVMDAMQFGLNPFHLAAESYVVQDQLSYGAKAIHAMVLRSGLVDGRLEITFTGEGEGLACRVSGKIKGSPLINVKTMLMRDVAIRNSPLWKTDPQQQLGYACERAWCRLYAPDAMMGLIAREDPPLIHAGTAEVVDAPSDLDKVQRALGVPEAVEAEVVEPPDDPNPDEPGKPEPIDQSELLLAVHDAAGHPITDNLDAHEWYASLQTRIGEAATQAQRQGMLAANKAGHDLWVTWKYENAARFWAAIEQDVVPGAEGQETLGLRP